MFVSKDLLTEKNIVGIKLISGEEMIGEVKTVDNDNVVLVKPLMLVMGPNNGMGFAPASMLGGPSCDVQIARKSITFVVLPDEQFVDGYKQSVSPIDLSQAAQGMALPK